LPATPSRLAERILPEADVHRMLSLEPDERDRAILMLLYASGVPDDGTTTATCWSQSLPNPAPGTR
jgi:hypothetical protein